MKLSSAVLLNMLFIVAWNDGNYCQSVGQTVGELPVPIANNILTILANGTVNLLGNCSNANNVSEVQYLLYTRQNSSNPIILNNSYNDITSSKPIIILIHGWNSNPNAESMAAIRNAYLQAYDCNLIAVNHSMYSGGDYQTAYCHAPAVGVALAQFLCNMSSTLNVNISSIHVVGHSLGAHIAGFAGNATKGICGAIGRITGLDPAGPLFQGINASQRLDSTDAIFVDVIHTNEGEFGYIGSIGHVDFYPNCGYTQPGCFNATVTSLSDIFNNLVSAVGCSHTRACFLFAESILNDAFYSTSCLLCGTPACIGALLGATHTYMGESCTSQPPSIEYTLTTNGESPYAQGPQRS